MREVRQHDKFITDLAAKLGRFLMRQFEKIFEQSQFMHHFECRRMDRVTTKVAQKVFVLFKDNDIDACAREQKAKHHARWAAAGNATTSVHLCRAIQRHRTPNGITIIASRNDACGDQVYPKTSKRNGNTSR